MELITRVNEMMERCGDLVISGCVMGQGDVHSVYMLLRDVREVLDPEIVYALDVVELGPCPRRE